MTITCQLEEDFRKRIMSGKRVKRHFSQLSEFERDLITDKKTVGWLMRHVAGERDDCMIVRQGLVDSTVTRSTIKAEAIVAIVTKTISRCLAETNLKP